MQPENPEQPSFPNSPAAFPNHENQRAAPPLPTETEEIQDELRRQRLFMNEVLETLPRGVVQMSVDDVLWLIEAVKTLGLSKLQASTLATRLSRSPWASNLLFYG